MRAILSLEELPRRDPSAGLVLLSPIAAAPPPIPPGTTIVLQPPPLAINLSINVQVRVEFTRVYVQPIFFGYPVPVVFLVPVPIPVVIPDSLFRELFPDPAPPAPM
jgi:hypothetical protein